MIELKNFSVMPLNKDHIDAVCEDIKEQVEKGVCIMPLFMMTLVPEGTPVVDKVTPLVKIYSEYKKKLDKMGVPSGILVQATIGHGRKLSESSPFRKIVGLVTVKSETICPYDDGFCDHMREVFAKIAAASPDHIMVDDDFRLIGRADGGCACPVHMARFNELSGCNFDRDTLRDELEGERGAEFIKIFVETQREAVLKAARAMREGIDSVDATIPGSFCGVGTEIEFGEEIAEILAGANNPITVRINNGNYTPAGARKLSFASYRAAVQAERIRHKASVILAETDTCPQNRYSTGAYSLHSHFTASILEGASGAKHWITRLAEYEPESGTAYRRLLSKYNGFHTALANIVPKLEWQGCRIPLTVRRNFIFSDKDWARTDGGEGFATHVLERFGIPLYFSSKEGGAVFLSGKADRKFTDAEILNMLKGPVFLASESAEALVLRGFGKYLGVDVKEHVGSAPSGERLTSNGKKMKFQMGIRKIIPTSPETVVHSEVYHSVGEANYEYLFPGVTSFKNSLGGTAVVFAGTPITNFTYLEAFSFLNQSRKGQFVELLSSLGMLPVYYVGDEEVYLRAAKMEDGAEFVCLFNIGFDPIDEIKLGVKDAFSKVERLTPDGKWEPVGFKQEDELLTIYQSALTLDPVVLRLVK